MIRTATTSWIVKAVNSGHMYEIKMILSQTMLEFITFCTVALLQLADTFVHGPTDYCMAAVFEPNCNQNEVVMIETAVYGRMKPGKCFPEERGKFGCSTDVQNLLDSLCSGRPSCSVKALHEDLILTKPCGLGSVGYLSVSYSCINVDSTNQCTNNEVKITTADGYISSPSSQGFQRQNCPVSITVPSGRLIKFTLYNFMKKSGSACYEIAVIKETDKQKSIHVCQSNPRTKEVMMTSSSHVTVHFSDLQIGESAGSFLLHFEATGCPQPDIPSNAHMTREGDRVKIKCNNSDSSWFIYCKKNKWTEMDRKCPKDWGISKIFKYGETDFPYGIFLTSFIGVGIGIFLGGFLLFLAINAFQRHQRRLRSAYGAPPVIPDPDYKIYDTAKMDLSLVPGFATGMRAHTLGRHQMSAPPVPLQPPEDDRRFSRHTYEKPKYNSTDNQHFVEA